MKISLLIPVTSNRRSFKSINESPLISILLRSFLKFKEGNFEYTFYVGYDKGDRFYTLNRDKIKNHFKECGVNLVYTEYHNPQKSPVFVWNKLFEDAYNNGEDYFYQIGDDIEIQSKWTSLFINKLSDNGDIGVSGPLDLNNKVLLTQSFVSKKHMDIFGFYFPEVFKNWYCDNWIQDTYKGINKIFKFENVLVKNSGGLPRYVVNKSSKKFLNEEVNKGVSKIEEFYLKDKVKFINTILIPYRNREEQLEYLIKNTIPLIKKNMDNVKILIIEQKQGGVFNKGRLLNVGIKESNSDYYIPQEVDVNPYEETIKKYYTKDISINGIYCSHTDTLGGIIKISREDILKMNGYTNDYWGWGCEDKNLQNRAEFFGLKVRKNILNNEDRKHDYFKIFNSVNDRIRIDLHNKTKLEYEKFKKMSREKKLNHIMKSGLNDLEYKVINREFLSENVERIVVDIGKKSNNQHKNNKSPEDSLNRNVNHGLNRVRKKHWKLRRQEQIKKNKGNE